MKDFISKYLHGDKIIWAIIVFLSIVSLVSVYSSIANLAYKSDNITTSSLITKHVLLFIAGYIILFFLHKISYKVYFDLAPVLMILAVFLLMLTLIKGVSANNASRWIMVFGIKFQSSDIAKIALTIYTAKILSKNQDSEENLILAYKNLRWYILITIALVFYENVSTGILLFASSFVLLFIGRVPLKNLLKFTGIMSAIVLVFVLIALTTSYKGRIITGINRFKTFQSNDVKINQQAMIAKSAIASSGFVGALPGNSDVKYILSASHSDFIYAIIIEELGNFIAFLVLAAYLFLLYRVGIIVRKSSMTFPALMAIGLTLNIVIQAFVNMMVAVNLFPVTGQQLPLVSKGGTSLIVTFVAFAIILNISKELKNMPENNSDLEEEEGLREETGGYL